MKTCNCITTSLAVILTLYAFSLRATEGNPMDPGLSQVRINEFLASNQNGIRDEDGSRQDWIELYNAGPSSVNLLGCYLTDTKVRLTQWRFPSFVLPSQSYAIVWASGKYRTNTLPLHTNFRLDTAGEFLALLDPTGTNLLSAFDPSYPPQRADISYGRDPLDPNLTGYYTRPTPGTLNSVSNAPGGIDFAGDVEFSRASGTFTSPFSLSLSSASSNAEIRYVVITNFAQTTNAGVVVTNVPTTNSSLYTGPILINTTVQVRARVFEPSKLPGTPVTMAYIAIAPEMAAFSSDLPVIVVHTLGGPISRTNDGTAYCMVFDSRSARSSLTNNPDTQSRIGLNVRGRSTADYPKNSLALEFWDEFNLDRDVPLLGLPAESDWALYGINFFEPGLISNAMFHWFGRQLGRYSSRTRFVEVFRKVDGGPVTSVGRNTARLKR